MGIAKIRKAVVFGAAESGIAASGFLRSIGADVVLTDAKAADRLDLSGLAEGVRLALGGHPDGIFDGADIVVISPGVAFDIAPLKKARSMGIEVISELELGWRAMRDATAQRPGGPIPFHAVTGTNGKSTTVTLLNLMLEKSGMKTIFGGNIGNALTKEAGNALESDCCVVEVSSFQLETIKDFAPKTASVLNVSQDHIDRHGSMDAYIKAKARIFENQQEDDFAILNADDPECLKAVPDRMRSQVYHFSRKKEVKGAFYVNGTIYISIEKPFPLMRADEIFIKGAHNIENSMASALQAILAGAKPEAVRDALREFKGLSHRLEFVRELRGVQYIDDSKGTNVGAVIKSLESYTSPVILIAGGRDKDSDFTELAPYVKGRVRLAVLIGESARKIQAAIGSATECVVAASMEEAVRISSQRAKPGDVVLLSPACASFDMFRDYKDRGNKFRSAAEGLS